MTPLPYRPLRKAAPRAGAAPIAVLLYCLASALALAAPTASRRPQAPPSPPPSPASAVHAKDPTPVEPDRDGGTLRIEIDDDDDEDAAWEAHRHEGVVRLNLAGDVTIEEGEVHEEDLIATGGHVIVNGEVRGDVVILNGELDINGRVKGDVVAILTDTELGDEARISGDMVHLGGHYEASPRAKVGGETFHTDLSHLAFGEEAREAAGGVLRLVYYSHLLFFAILFWGMLIAVCVAPERVTAAGEALGTLWGRALFIGLLAYAAYFILLCIFVVLSFILIGIPLLALLAFAWFVTKALGLAALLWLVGDRILRNVLKREPTALVAFLGGFLIYLPTQIIPFHFGFPLLIPALLGSGLSTCLTVLAVGLTLITQFGVGSPPGFRLRGSKSEPETPPSPSIP